MSKGRNCDKHTFPRHKLPVRRTDHGLNAAIGQAYILQGFITFANLIFGFAKT